MKGTTVKSPTKTTDWIADPSSMLSRAVRNDLMDALAMVYHPIVEPGPSATEIAYRQARALEKITIGPVTFVCDPTKDLTPMTNPVQAVSVVFFDSAGSATNSVRQYTYRAPVEQWGELGKGDIILVDSPINGLTMTTVLHTKLVSGDNEYYKPILGVVSAAPLRAIIQADADAKAAKVLLDRELAAQAESQKYLGLVHSKNPDVQRALSVLGLVTKKQPKTASDKARAARRRRKA